jgi:hypothetical protein
MTNRSTIFLSAVFTGLVASASTAVPPLSAKAAPGECLVNRPKTAAPPGQFWLHLTEWTGNRHCWVLRAKLESPSQAKGSASIQAARAGARAAGPTPARSIEDPAIDELSTRAELSARSQVKNDDKGASATGATAGVSERPDQDLLKAEHPDSARLSPPASPAPEAKTALSLASEPPATTAFAAPAQKTSQLASNETGPVTVLPIAETTHPTRIVGAPNFLQMLLLAIFCGPAIYLLTAGAIRRRTEPARALSSFPGLAGLEDAPAERALLPPRPEPRENARSSQVIAL